MQEHLRARASEVFSFRALGEMLSDERDPLDTASENENIGRGLRRAGPHPWVVRICGIGAVSASLWVFFGLSAGCVPYGSEGNMCPSFALGDPWVLRGERATVALLGMTFFVVVLCRVIWQGKLPDKIGRDGAEWATTESSRGLAALEAIVRRQGSAIKQLTEFLKKQV